MLKLKKVSKTYLSKSKEEVLALKEVSLQFPDKGMVFILGKSGSGKSTLLNIIGGIDSPSDGEVFYNGISFKNYKSVDYENYRNMVVGFVFQEFNLLKDLTVKENIALALQLGKTKNVDEKTLSAIEAVGLSEDYLTRKIGELSGGEKQRIAIARSIVKNSKIILADEPTGNLDSETGKEIWNILKSISEKQLVIVVSHDEESARLYADRIVTISDGTIIGDEVLSGNFVTEVCVSSQSFFKETKRTRLSNKICLKLGFNNLRLRKGKTVSVILLSILTIFSLALCQMIVWYSTESMTARLIDDNDIKYFQVSQGQENPYGEFISNNLAFKDETIEYLYDNAYCISANRISGPEDIIKLGLSFVSEPLPLSKDAFYITDFALEKAYEKGNSIFIVDGDRELPIIKEVHTAEKIVGKRMRVNYSEKTYLIAGVIDTDSLTSAQRGGLPNAFYTKNFIGQQYSALQISSTGTYSVYFGDEKCRPTCVLSSAIPQSVNRVLTKDGFIEPDEWENSDFSLEEDEVLLSFDFFYTLFDVQERKYYLSKSFSEIEVPEVLGSYQEITVVDKTTGEVYINAGKYKVVGIIFTSDVSSEYTFYMEESKVQEYLSIFDRTYDILVKTDSIDDLEKFLTIYRKDYSGAISATGVVNVAAYAVEFEFKYYIKPVLEVFACALLIILFFMVTNLISFGILKRKKEIGILSALGVGNGDISKMFLLETTIISVITFVVVAGLTILASSAFNYAFLLVEDFVVPYLRPDFITFLALAVFSCVPLLLATLLPLRKIFKLKPVDAIREV